jgi:[acyl-carrier-protein] S-malonyltransferase
MGAFQSAGIDTVVECGPGKVLSGLFKRFDRQLKVMPLLNLSSVNEFLES